MPTSLRRSLFIGLGGTGIKTILKTKSILMDNYRQGEELPPILGFLGIDTDSAEYDTTVECKQGKIKLSAKEKFSIGVANPIGFFNTGKRDFGWIPAQNQVFINTLDRGAGQVRTNGRLAFMFWRSQLKDKIISTLNDINSASIDDEKWKNYKAMGGGVDGAVKVEIHLVFSICGGTGAGTFLDVAYLIREIAKENRFDITLNGYAVLPGVFKQEIKNLADKSRVEPNAYGALRDLDYLMSLNNGGEQKSFKLNWRTASKETSELPFDSVALVDNKNAEGLVYKRMSDLTEMLSLVLLSTTGQIGNAASSVGDNVKNDMINGAFDYENKRAWVAAIGAAALVYNSDDIAAVYSKKAQNKLIHSILNCDEDANNIANVWIDNVQIREHNRDDVIDRLYDINNLTSVTLNAKDFTKHNVREKIQSKVEMYYQGQEPSAEEWNKKVDDLTTLVTNQLTEKVKEIVDRFLSVGLATDVLTDIKQQIVDIFMIEMNNEQEEHSNDLKAAEAELTAKIDSLFTYKNSGMHLFGDKTESYLNTIKLQAKTCLTERIEVKRRAYANQFYSRLVEKVSAELANMVEIKKKFKAILEKNELEIHSYQNRVGKNLTVEFDLAEDIIKKVELKNEDIPASSFVEMLPEKTLYISAPQDTYATCLEKLSTSLRGYTDLLNENVDTILNNMSNEEFEDVVRRVFARSVPFFKIDDHGRQVQNMQMGAQELFYVCVPDINTNRLTKDGAYREIAKAEHATPISTGLYDRVIIYRQKRPVPAFAISGLEAMGEVYERQQNTVSFHFDEALRKRMNDEFFEFEPKGANVDEAIEAWVKGCIIEIVRFDKTKGVYVYFDEGQQIKGAGEIWTNLHTAYRDKAFEQFASDANIIRQIDEKFEAHLAELGTTKVKELYEDVSQHYFEKYSRCQLTKRTVFGQNVGMEYLGTQRLFKQEGEAIDRIFNDR